MIRKLAVLALCLLLCGMAQGARLFDNVATEFLATGTPVVTAAPITVSAWMRPDEAAPSGQGTIWWVGDDNDQNVFHLRYESSRKLRWVARQAGTGNFAESTSLYTVNTWHHVAGIEAATNDRRIFFDGVREATNTVTRVPVVSEIIQTRIGAKKNVTAQARFSGDLAHVAVWDVALTDQEIATLAEGISPLRVRRVSLIAYWPIGGQSPEPDIAGGLSLTLNGTPAQSEEPPIPYAVVAPGN